MWDSIANTLGTDAFILTYILVFAAMLEVAIRLVIWLKNR